MIPLSCFFSVLQLVLFFSHSIAQPPETPTNQWEIQKPVFNQSRLALKLEYPISNYVPFENLVWKIYDGKACGSGAGDITENDYMKVDIEYDEGQPMGEGDAWRYASLLFEFDESTIRESPIIVDNGLETMLSFCVRLAAYTAPEINPGAVEIFFKETFVSVNIQQTGNLETEDWLITPEDVQSESASQPYYLVGFICDENNEPIEPPPIFQGMPTKVCVRPNDEAQAAGVYMRAIDSFWWTREDIYQTAIVSHQTAAPLTEVDCAAGMEVCSFITMLKASFFYKLGSVDGAGIGWLQFGQGANSTARRAQIVDDVTMDEFGNPSYPNYAGHGPWQVKRPVTRLYTALGYLCDEDNNELDPLANPLTSGDKARVCVRPNEVAVEQDNVRIRSIDRYTWERTDTNITQDAVVPNAVAAPETEIFCERGSLVCAFETVLKDDFYGTPGLVGGKGIIWLQFGPDSRRLQTGVEFDLGFGLLPNMEEGFAGASPFDAMIYVIPPLNARELFKCRAYECDNYNKELVSNDAREEGASIRMCVKPTAAAEEAGAKMWSVEWWTWSQLNITQPAVVKQGVEAPDGRTLLMCERFMDVCIFHTRLIPDFFKFPVNSIEGNGVCWITFGDGALYKGMIEEEEVDEGGIDPSRDHLYAGISDIAIIFPVTGNYVPGPVCPPQDHELGEWWKEEDQKMKVLYICSVVAACTGLCCLWGYCFFFNRRTEDEEEIEENGKVVVNVDIEDTKHTEKHVDNYTSEEHVRSSKSTSKDSSTDEHHEEHRKSKRGLSSRSLADDEPQKFRGKPSDRDVCFGDMKHPGTKDCRKQIREYVKENPDEPYGPDVFQSIKKKLKDRCFLVREDGSKTKWRETKKHEAISSIGEMWREEKYKAK